MNENCCLKQKIRRLSFTLDDVGLYLDTHPDSAKARAYYRTVQHELHQAEREYEKRFGPLTQQSGDYDDGWSWINGPWPWEEE